MLLNPNPAWTFEIMSKTKNSLASRACTQMDYRQNWSLKESSSCLSNEYKRLSGDSAVWHSPPHSEPQHVFSSVRQPCCWLEIHLKFNSLHIIDRELSALLLFSKIITHPFIFLIAYPIQTWISSSQVGRHHCAALSSKSISTAYVIQLNALLGLLSVVNNAVLIDAIYICLHIKTHKSNPVYNTISQ